ncbi:MAG: hypothetical protein IJK24_08045 [Oscillospiraceae bacterium]|nr:hypothetical protein [Oscillospiraceae bacterium]
MKKIINYMEHPPEVKRHGNHGDMLIDHARDCKPFGKQAAEAEAPAP